MSEDGDAGYSTGLAAAEGFRIGMDRAAADILAMQPNVAAAVREIQAEYERDPQADDQYRAGLAFALERLAEAYGERATREERSKHRAPP